MRCALASPGILSESRVRIHGAAALSALLLVWAAASGAAEAPPNIVLLIDDDVGYGDTGFMGSEVAHTPNLDQLAEGGTVFPLGYATASTCRPSAT